MGHRARGLQRRRRGVGLLPPRPRALAGLPLERGRPGRHLRLPPAPVLRPLAVERPRPVPQGEDVRPDRGRGEPRRGRQGLLLLPRLDADALVHEVPLQVPAGRVPLRPARRGEPPPGQDAAGVRAGRHRDLRRVALLRRRRRVRQGRGRRHPDPHQRQQPRPGGGADRGAADALVPQHLELGARRPPPTASRRGGSRHPARHALGPRRVRPLLLRRRRAALHRERDEHREAVRRPVADPLRQGRLPRVRRGRPARGRQSGGHRNEGRRALCTYCRRRRDGHHRAAPGFSEWREPARGAFRRLRRGVPAAQGGGGRVLRRRPAARPFARCPAGGAPGIRRDAVVQAVLPLRRQRLVGGRPGAAEPAARAPAGAQPPVDEPVRPRRDLDARQVGVPLVRRLGPGLPLRRPRARRPAVRQGADPPDAAGVVHAPQRADPRLRMGLRRRQPAGPLHGRGRGVRDRAPPHRGRRLRVPRSASSTRCFSTSPGG